LTEQVEDRSKIELQWEKYFKMAKKANQKLEDPILPYSEGVNLYEVNSVYRDIYDKEKYINN
jgi:hypothetical protein